MFNHRQTFLRSEPPGYLKALDDFGISDLMEKLGQETTGDSDTQELASLATLLVKHLAHSLDCRWLRTYFHAVKMGRGDEISQILTVGRSLRVPVESPSFFLDAQPPRFEFGSVLCWWLLEDEPELNDWGIAIGRFYGYAPERHRWMWCYLLLLDPNSPSARWCVIDTAWEDDLERLDSLNC